MDGMSSEVFSEALAWFVPAALGAAAGWAGGALRSLRRVHDMREERDEALVEGVKTLLRCEIVRAHDAFVVAGEFLDVDSLEHVQKVHDSYRRLGGNDVGTHLYRQISLAGLYSRKEILPCI